MTTAVSYTHLDVYKRQVHGQSNIVGATLFPHNIGLGATRNPELMRRIGEVTAVETRVTGMELSLIHI